MWAGWSRVASQSATSRLEESRSSCLCETKRRPVVTQDHPIATLLLVAFLPLSSVLAPSSNALCSVRSVLRVLAPSSMDKFCSSISQFQDNSKQSGHLGAPTPQINKPTEAIRLGDRTHSSQPLLPLLSRHVSGIPVLSFNWPRRWHRTPNGLAQGHSRQMVLFLMSKGWQCSNPFLTSCCRCWRSLTCLQKTLSSVAVRRMLPTFAECLKKFFLTTFVYSPPIEARVSFSDPHE